MSNKFRWAAASLERKPLQCQEDQKRKWKIFENRKARGQPKDEMRKYQNLQKIKFLASFSMEKVAIFSYLKKKMSQFFANILNLPTVSAENEEVEKCLNLMITSFKRKMKKWSMTLIRGKILIKQFNPSFYAFELILLSSILSCIWIFQSSLPYYPLEKNEESRFLWRLLWTRKRPSIF